ncbi:hypothetical protein TNCV_2488581 [Trichonephila clavipes]|nr:hypothetical protein TNCV_2488581 [Trichonephila clavipes]
MQSMALQWSLILFKMILLKILAITGGIAPPWVPTRMFRIKISKEKGFVIVAENSIKFRDINGAVWMFVDARHSDFGVVT